MKARGTPRTTRRTQASRASYRVKPAPSAHRIRDTTPEFGAPEPVPVAFGVVMADRGRLVLPVEVRERLHIKPGDRLTLRVEPDGTMKLLTAAAFARSLRGMFKHLGVPGRSIVDDLIAERRREARMEEEDTRAMLAGRPRPRLGDLRRAGADRG